MENNNVKNVTMGTKVTAIIFCLFLFSLFSFVAYINLPRNQTINISEYGVNSFDKLEDRWFCLKEGNYKVLDEFGEYVTMDSTLLYSVKYYYFNVLVTDAQGEQFIMAVRTDKKTEELRKGNSVDLYGMVSTLKEETKSAQLANLNDKEGQILSLSLNDNDTSVLTKSVTSIIYIGLALIALGFLFRILFRKSV